MNTPTVFIVYSWDSNRHKEWVTHLAKDLRSDGIEAVLDQWELAPGDRLPEFMETQISECDFVLIVCTPRYKKRSDDRQGGVGYEKVLLTSENFPYHNDKRFIPILASGTWEESAPRWIKSSRYLDMSNPNTYADHYRELVDTLHSSRKTAPPVRIRSKYEHALELLSTIDAEGQPNIQSRLFAIQMLEQIMVESDDHYLPTIGHLCAYVRHEAPASSLSEFPGTQLRRIQGALEVGNSLFGARARESLAEQGSGSVSKFDISRFESQVRAYRKASYFLGSDENATSTSEKRNFQEFYQWLAELPRPREDIRATVNAIANRPRARQSLERQTTFQIDLSGCNLRLIRLEGPHPNLDHAIMRKSLLEGFDANGCSAISADFSRSNMEGVNFSDANCSNSTFDRSVFELANFRCAKLSGASFGRSMISTTEFDHANLVGASFSCAYIHNVLFWHSNRVNLDFVSEMFVDCDLRFSQMIQGLPSMHNLEISRASISGYELFPDQGREWIFRFCYFNGEGRQYDSRGSNSGKVDLFGSSFRNCLFRDGDWKSDVFANTFGDASAVLPKYVERPRQWDSGVLDDKVFFVKWRAWLSEIGHESEFGDQVPEEFRDVSIV